GVAFVNGPTSLFNSIVQGNGTDGPIGTTVATGGNLVGVDPLFVNAALRDYRLLPGSPAIDAGVEPPGGLSETDITGRTRVVGGTVDIGAHEHQGPARLAAGALAHTLGYLDTPWRSDLDLANLGSRQADLTLRHRTASGDQTKPVTLTPGETRGWSDVLVDVFGVGAGDRTSGALQIEDPTGAVVAAVRTYADGGAAGTYGQSYPVLPDGAGITAGTVGILPLVKSNTGFYSNVGILNLGTVKTDARVTLVGPRGTLGSPVTLSADPGRWTQLSDVFARAGVASASVAYATVEPLTAGARLWGAASLVDRLTRDPTTVEASVPVAAGAVQRVASVAHSSGSGGTAWRSTVAVVNPGSDSANVTLTFRGTNTLVRAARVGAHGVSEWPDVLVDLFNMRPDESASGSLEIVADRPVAVGCRTLADKGEAGTYGQSYPALTADRGIMPGETGVLAQLRKTSTAYTNIGALNLSTGPCTASVQLHDAQGQAIGSALEMKPAAGAWTQVTDAFRVAGAGGADAASARVTVRTEGCSMWFYASVIDSLTRDPTTIELARPFVVGPVR
ncbi:MAG TPA: choice-of-anchor Q domain-containing protein, partial [Thermoanaerobaculaceae bacterium]|nr:choice-of-anchor Q domain-containing protein [Thermoanaerobaculaceae bacterium]